MPVAWLARKAGAESQLLDRTAVKARVALGALEAAARAAVGADDKTWMGTLFHLIITLVIIAFGLGVIKWYYSTGRKPPSERRSYLARRNSQRASTVAQQQPLVT